MIRLAASGLLLALALACAGPAAAGDVSPADKAAVLQAAHVTLDARGLVKNACDEKVAPTFTAVEIAGLGTTILMVLPGGPNTATCYGDGPGQLSLFQRTPAGFKLIFEAQGYIGVLATSTGGVRDIAVGGPGFSSPVYVWNGSAYAASRRTVSDAVYGAAPSYP